MNYAGKFDAAIPFHGEGSHSPAYVHVDSFTAKAHGHVPDGAVVVPDPNLIFNGEFKRSGLDLVLSHEGRDFVVHDYFRGDKRAALASSDGAHLTGDVVNALTGHVQVAQAVPGTAAAQVIGHVTKLSGSATAIRNGVSVVLNNGDNVEKGDVVSTGADSTLGITFIDGTVFGLSSNARMVLNEMVYDPNGSNNSSLLSLVAGTITFVAGETAKHGDMKVDTPVATMGIRGTAVLTQINFVVPAGGGDPQPQASFQVLVEPNGTTGSYILFDKITLLPIATVNQAGQMIQISGGNVSISNALMSPDVQKLITDVFTLKFTDNNSNTKLTNFTDTITPGTQDIVFKSGSGDVAIATFTNLNHAGPEGPGESTSPATRIPGQPLVRSLDLSGNVNTAFSLSERAGTTGDTTHSDTISGRITFVDQNLGDRPTVSISLAEAPNYVYKSAGQQDVTGSLSALQKQDIAATLIQISVAPDGGNNNNGSAVWTYTIPDNVFDFLAAGETLTLTYMVRVDTNFEVNPESRFIPITITITGTNDKPVITSSVPTITFEGGTSVPGGPLISDEATSGTLSFADVDLTDTHTVSVALTSASLPDGSTVPPGPLAAFQSAMSVAIASGADSTGDGTGTINWSLADLPVYLADFIPRGEVLTLVYTVTVTDAQGATAQQTITVTITGTDAPAVVWIATEKEGAPSGGFWKDAANWATGTVPTIDDDVIVITDQLHGLTPSFPATIDAPAYAKSVTMNDFGGPPPQLINQSSLTIAGSLDMGADSIFTNAATGTTSVGGLAEILDTSVFTNAGHLTLKAGGDFAVGTTITNSGTLELFGGTLKTLAEVHNAGGTLKTDAGATLIVDGTTVDGGTVTILGTLELDGVSHIENGTLNNSGTINVKGGFVGFAGETVDNTSSGVIEVLANGWLTIHQGSSVTNAGQITIDASGRLVVNNATIGGAGEVIGTGNGEGGPVFNAGLQGAGTITNNGEIDLHGGAVLSGGILNNGALFNNDALFSVSGAGNALSEETVTNAGRIEVVAGGALAIDLGSTVDNSSGIVVIIGNATLTLDDATISGGAIMGAGTIEVAGASRIDGGATLSISTVTVDAELTLDGITVSGTDITDNSSIVLGGTVKLKDGARIKGGAVTNTGTLEIAGAATLLNDVVANTGTIAVDDGRTLTLSGTEISGGAIDNYSGALGGTIDVTGNSKIDGNATLSNGAVTVESGITLTLGDATVAGAAIANHGAVTVDAGKTLTLSGVGVTGGALIVQGALESTGATTITDASITNNGLIEAIGGVLTLATMTPASIANAGTLRAKGAELDIDHQAVTNSGTLAAINGGTLKLIATTVTNGTGAVSVTLGSTLDLVGAVIDGGTVTIAGTLESTGTSAIDNADITNTGTITVTGGTLTIDPATIHAITNHGLIEAVTGGTLKLTAAIIANTGGTISVGGTSKLYLTNVSINGGSLSNAGNLYSVLGSNTITAGVTNTGGTIEVQAGTLNLAGGITGAGTLSIDDGATLELGGADAQTVTFAGGTGTLQLDKVAGQYFTGTIAGEAAADGTFTVTGDADIAASAGDALDFTVSEGTNANVALTLTGKLTGATNGIGVTQNGVGDVTIVNHGSITGTSLVGISVTQNDADAAGDPVATGSTHITNSASGSIVGAAGHAAIFIQENATGSATIDNFGTIGPAAASNVTATTYAIVETGGAITINNSGHINGNISVASATFYNNAGGIWTVAGTSVFGNVSSIVNGGEIDLLNGASISVAGPGITNTNEIESWGTASITGTITNNHSIEVHTGTLTLFGSLSGSGSVTIDAGATLEIKNAVAQTITFAGAGAELEIDTETFGGSIAGFAANEKIDLSTFTWDSGSTAVYDAQTGNLVVSDTHGHSFTLKLIGNYSDAHFITSSDYAGGTIVEVAPVDHWKYSASGDWNVASNWSLGVPGASYDVRLDAPGTYTVDSTTSVTIHDLTVASGVKLQTEPFTVFTVKGDVVVNGLIEAGPFSGNDVSTIDIKGNVRGTGAIEISNKAIVEIEGSVSGIKVYYDNGLGTLILDHAKDFHGLISGSPAGAPLSSNNLIDLKDLAWTPTMMSAHADYNADTNITTVDFYNGTTTVTLSFLGNDLNWHLQSDGQGGTTVYDPLADTPMTIESGTVLNLSEASSQDVTFANNSGTTGTFAIEHAADFTGTINGFAGDGTVANSDLLDLKDIDFTHLTGVTWTENADHLGGVLTLSDGTETATIKFAGSYSIDSFEFVSDGNGGTLVVDPPTGPTLVGTSGQDQFAFTSSALPVQSTIVDFDLGQDKIDLREFASIKSFSDIVITQQAGGALVTLDDHQSILLKNLVASSLHASDFIVANHA
ncbi:hypothetical protein GGD63_005384 [Bradyrhizobium sp. cir1]|uniref:FecR domain-containing protein n=1 Tax=Bradyrhizobium sp. cir1 TaxID=1445730 RepID=UPI001605C299|nr:FecR domain-containing protein [Bradyrhizobium sp. cir1]MBB4372574.1 hypothetical protein [Bradyrhizobium sp. cir1]